MLLGSNNSDDDHMNGLKWMHKQYPAKMQWIGWTALGLCCLLLFTAALSLHSKPLQGSDYVIQGIDLSHHQPEVNWQAVGKQPIHFVYLKATEGGDFQDRRFQQYWLAAREQGLLVGAYHFYRICREGQVQADHFIRTVPKKADALPPVMDLEFDGNCQNPYSKEKLLKEIKTMYDALYQHYGKAPIFYVSTRFYELILKGEFQQVPLWIREYSGQPQLSDQRAWLMWQYTDRGRMAGIKTGIDRNAFYGGAEQWRSFLQQQGFSDAAIEANLKRALPVTRSATAPTR